MGRVEGRTVPTLRIGAAETTDERAARRRVESMAKRRREIDGRVN